MKALKNIARIATIMALAMAAASCGKDSYIGEAEEDGSRYYIKYEAVSEAGGSMSAISTNTAVGSADFKATSEFQTITGPVSRNFDTAITATVLESKAGESEGGVTTRIYVSKDAGDFVLVASASGEGSSHCEYRIDF